ncbi:branched-chain amino acid ABC transporter permease [Salipiger sp. IMCC34102]|uniref:branched-chain amino acid ABC transporter permease n=1 Tax=Salipiger sp. IMCC34102 TaxID=2510647 RepID=UPI00101BCCB4|nr:branched-chain amino acid ABC transporter permease [Salipiger sp. IMCC34102]RYH02650.1 branched-chain amino acid ABC transporter permease [Salipiger sp. IMCC34102]
MTPRAFSAGLLILGGALAAWSAMRLDPGSLYLLSEVVVIMILAQMWNLLAGYAGQISLGHQLFVGLGGYALFLAANNTGVPIWIWLALAPVLAGALAIPLGMVVFHLKHAYFAVGMWVAAEIVAALVLKWSWTGGSAGLILRPGGESMTSNPERVIFFGLAFGLVALVVALRAFLASDTGLALLGMRDNPQAAEASGVNVRRMHLLVFVISAMGCAAAGAAYYVNALYISPSDAFQMNWLIAMMFVTVIGGLGTLTGPILGTVLFIAIREVMTNAGYSGGTYWIVIGALAVVVLLVAPRGLWPAIQDLTDYTKRKAFR